MNYLSVNEVKDHAFQYLVDVAKNVQDIATFGTIANAVLRFVAYVDEKETELEK